MIAQDLIYTALRKIGQVRPGYGSQPELLSDALTEFQAMYDNWNAERTMNYSVPDFIFPIGTSTSLNGIYGPFIQWTIGPAFTFSGTTVSTSKTVTVVNTIGLIIGQYVTGAGIPANTYITALSVNTSIMLSNAATASATVTLTVPPSFLGPRPEAIVRMNLYMTSVSPGMPTRIPLSPIGVEEWGSISVLQLTPINVTTVYYYDPQMPQGVINVWPPLNGNSLEIFTWGFLTPPTLLTTSMILPPAYQDAIVYTLAERLWPMATRQLMVNKVSHMWICGQAKIARDKIRRVNAPMPRLANDFSGGRRTGIGVCDWNLLLTGQPY